MRFFWRDFENWNFDISRWLNFACILDHVGGQIWTSLNVTHFRPKHAQLQAGIRSHLSQSVWEQHIKMRFSQTQKAVKKRGFWGSNLTCLQLKYKLCQHDFWYGAMLGKVPRVISEKSCWSPKIVAECARRWCSGCYVKCIQRNRRERRGKRTSEIIWNRGSSIVA